MKPDSNENPWTVLKQHLVYESPWIAVEHHDVLNPAGNPGTYSVVHFKHRAVGVVPIDEENYTWIVGQYRYPFNTYTWEIPEGGGGLTEAPIDAAKRELREECGILAREYIPIQQLQLSNSATDEVAYLFVARGLTFEEAQPDENEALSVRKIHFDELYSMVLKGEITDSLSVAAVLKLKLLMLEGKL
jgi:8-oxo-dGTP pyrophosphatase MutT (NUDIX family)